MTFATSVIVPAQGGIDEKFRLDCKWTFNSESTAQAVAEFAEHVSRAAYLWRFGTNRQKLPQHPGADPSDLNPKISRVYRLPNCASACVLKFHTCPSDGRFCFVWPGVTQNRCSGRLCGACWNGPSRRIGLGMRWRKRRMRTAPSPSRLCFISPVVRTSVEQRLGLVR
jgi:hypothetical protein